MDESTVERDSRQRKRPSGLCSSIEGDTPSERALDAALRYGAIDGDHHKTWVIDQMVRALLGTDEAYAKWAEESRAGDDGPETYRRWDTGIAP